MGKLVKFLIFKDRAPIFITSGMVTDEETEMIRTLMNRWVGGEPITIDGNRVDVLFIGDFGKVTRVNAQ